MDIANKIGSSFSVASTKTSQHLAPMRVHREGYILVTGKLRYCVLKEGTLTTYAPDITTIFDRYYSLWFPCFSNFRKRHPVGEIVPIVDVPKSEFVLSQCNITEHNAAGVKPGDHSFESTSDPRLWRIKIQGEHYTTYLKPVKQEMKDLEEFKLWVRDLKNVAKASKRWTTAENVVTLPGVLTFGAIEGVGKKMEGKTQSKDAPNIAGKTKKARKAKKKKRTILQPDNSPASDREYT